MKVAGGFNSNTVGAATWEAITVATRSIPLPACLSEPNCPAPTTIEIDADGNVYIVEDQPGGKADIWFATDANNNGVAESIGRWATTSTVGAEPTGLYFDKFNPNVAYVNVMHPDSGNDTMVQITASEFQKQKTTP